ncbi:hypothetical protein BGW36DRAFT_304654 [Talaromyces proteolyticus]|uniref:Uncharacterized protein n=1 Tax=Talaromyces proteolyticus TaxID=1131652 RepID=A0AAD4KM11_9EURO|nr:uncharacterized protein BGW36DRAFT_304654 [Talaromyces proteolyticus]KAH8691557.1 hypothetical protein BGW36DRAFT_304654 [Talaromyces proteolyticus]
MAKLWLVSVTIFLISLSLSVAAATTNQTATDTGNQSLGWQDGGDRRGTWSIISDCLATIFACTWSIQHLNIPSSKDSKWTRWWRSVKWMLITVLFPEFIVLHAVFELVMGFEALREMDKSNKLVRYPWWFTWLLSPSLSVRSLAVLLKHIFQRKKAAQTNGPEDLQDGEEEGRRGGGEEEEKEEDNRWTLTHCLFANMGGVYYRDAESGFPLTALQLAREMDGFRNQCISGDEIDDRSKQDWFAKIVAVLQFLQLALSLIVRADRSLDFSQLETVTLGFAVCGVVTYILYLPKPQNVQTPIFLAPGDSRIGGSGRILRYEKTFDSFWGILLNEERRRDDKQESLDKRYVDRVPNDNIPMSNNQVAHSGIFVLAFASGLFGAMHAIAWNFEFPTHVEQIIWRTATVMAAVSPVVGLIAIPLAQLTVSAGDPQAFMRNCLRLLREYSWHVADKVPVDQAHGDLENIYALRDPDSKQARQWYKVIFAGDTPNPLGRQLVNFLDQFKALLNLIDERKSKKLNDSAKTNVFPQKNMLPRTLNVFIFYTTGLLLRRMPDTVYLETPWTSFIPSLGSHK